MIKIKSLPSINPKYKDATAQYYTFAIASVFLVLERLEYLVAKKCALYKADGLALLNGLQQDIMDVLAQNSMVQIGIIGYLQVGVGKPSAQMEDLTAFNVRSAHVNSPQDKHIKKCSIT